MELLPSASNTLSLFCFSLLFILPQPGELANLRGDKGQMDFGALDYSNDRGKVRQRGVVEAAGYPFTHITIPLRSTRGKSYQSPINPKPRFFIKRGEKVATTIEDFRGLKSAP